MVIIIIITVSGIYFANYKEIVGNFDKNEEGKDKSTHQPLIENNAKALEGAFHMIAENAVFFNMKDLEEYKDDDIDSKDSDTDVNLGDDSLEDGLKDTSEGKTGSRSETALEDKKDSIIEGDSEGNDDETNRVQPTESTNIVAGQNPSEGIALMTYVNQYRAENGINALVWNESLEQEAQGLSEYSVGSRVLYSYGSYIIGRQCNGAKNAQKAVSDWMTGNAYIPSEAEALLNTDFTQIGGALYYLPDGNEYGYHYFWVICLQ